MRPSRVWTKVNCRSTKICLLQLLAEKDGIDEMNFAVDVLAKICSKDCDKNIKII